jgi:hypothetical protein
MTESLAANRNVAVIAELVRWCALLFQSETVGFNPKNYDCKLVQRCGNAFACGLFDAAGEPAGNNTFEVRRVLETKVHNNDDTKQVGEGSSWAV